MRQHVAFLHTSPVHVETFDRLLRAADPSIRIDHVVAEDLLTEAQRVGIDDAALVRRIHAAMTEAASGGAALVVCTCSTIGGPAERIPPGAGFSAVRIDRAMADRAVALGSRILIAAALESALEPSAQLVRESAAAARRNVELRQLFVSGAWAHFLSGDRRAYLEAVASAVRAAARGFDAVVLAQASMAGAADALQDLGVAVLTSPELGVRSLIARLREAG